MLSLAEIEILSREEAHEYQRKEKDSLAGSFEATNFTDYSVAARSKTHRSAIGTLLVPQVVLHHHPRLIRASFEDQNFEILFQAELAFTLSYLLVDYFLSQKIICALQLHFHENLCVMA